MNVILIDRRVSDNIGIILQINQCMLNIQQVKMYNTKSLSNQRIFGISLNKQNCGIKWTFMLSQCLPRPSSVLFFKLSDQSNIWILP